MVMHVELQATCSALGYHEGTRYVKEPDCLETVKELIRFLRREDDTCDIRRQLGHAQIVQKDLLPLVKQHHTDKALFDTVVRLLVNLTQPVLVCFNNHLPDEKTMRQYCLEIESHLQDYKEAFVDEELFAVLTKKLSELLELDWEHRHEDDKLNLERMLVLVRNVLHIPPDPATEQRTDDDASLHDQILWAIHVSGMEDLLLYIGSSENERQLCMHILEIVSLMFREQSPEILALAGVQRSMSEKERDERELEVARAKEKAQKKSTLLRFNTRHSNFGGTYVMTNTKSLGDKELIYHKSVQDADNFTLDTNKKRRKRPRNRAPIKDTTVIRRSTLSIRLGLKEFCVQFLENAYNLLMYAVKDNLVRETTQDLDETYYLWSMQFFMEFCRHHSGHVDFVSETMSVPTLHYIYNNLLRYYEMIMVEKKEAIAWGRRVHLALRAYQELLMTLESMDKSNNSHLRDSARVIKSNVFYVMEFRDIFVTLLKRFDETKNSRSYLKDLAESTHLFLRMLERLTKTSSHLVVQGGKKRKRNKKAKKAPAKKPEEQLEDTWQAVSSELSALLQGREEVPQDVAPFDAASEVDVDQQRVDAMVRIQTALRRKRAGEAVAIFRAAREVWPERDEFGSQDISVEEEFMALREIFLAPLPNAPDTEETQPEEMAMEEEEEDNEEEETTAQRGDWEQEFNFTEYLMNFAKPPILKAYVILAADFEKNSAHTNHCVAKMLHRMGFDLGFIGMLFQASLFRVFQKLMLGPSARSGRFKELYTLGVHVIRKFSQVAESNKKVFMEMLFYKGNVEAMQITEGYDFKPGNGKVAWTEDEENELTRLFEDFSDVQNPEKDAVDLIMESWTGSDKTRGQIIRHLRNLRLITSVKDLRQKKESTWVWTEDDEEELRQAYEEHKESGDPLTSMIAALSKPRSKQKVTEKLLAMGVVDDKKQLHKKRQRKSEGSRRRRGKAGSGDGDGWDNGREEKEIIDDWSSDDEAPAQGNLPSDEEILSSPTASDASSDDDDDSDDDEGDIEMTSESHQNEASPSSDLVQMVKNIVDKGYKNEVGWVHRLLTQNANNREGKDKIFSVPIVPLTEENETAMEDPMFMECLQALGLSPPANEQEMFWRIPAELTTADLRTLAKGIELDDEGQPLNPDTLAQIKRSKPTPATKKDKQKKDKQKKEKKKRKRDDKARSKDRKKQEKEAKKKAEKEQAEKEKAEKERGKRKEKKKNSDEESEISDISDISDIDEENKASDISDSDEENNVRDKNHNDGKEAVGERKGSKLGSASQRRDALKAMLQRRKGKTVANRKRKHSRENADSEVQDMDETDGASQTTPAANGGVASLPSDMDTTPSKPSQRSKRRVQRMMDSDSDSDDDANKLVIDHDKTSSHATPTKPAKRIRLLDSDLSDDDNEKENMETSAVNYHSDEDAKTSQSQPQSQSQSQGLLDFGDSDEDADKNGKKGEEKGDDDESSDDDVPLTAVAKKKAAVPESFPATMFSQGPPDSDDSEIDDHVPLGALKKRRKIISDDEDE